MGCSRDTKRVEFQPPLAATSVDVDSHLGQPRARGAREASIRPTTPCGVRGATRCVTPRQTCPRPNGFGRNLRSKTRWFTGFCNSHQVSHFATFFIDARAKISVAESRLILNIGCIRSHAPATRARDEHAQVHVPWRRPRRGSLLHRAAPLAEEHRPTSGGGGNSSSVRLR